MKKDGGKVMSGSDGAGKLSLKEGKHAEAISHNIQSLHGAGMEHHEATHTALKLAGVSQHLVRPVQVPKASSSESGGQVRGHGGGNGVGAPSGGYTAGGMHQPAPRGHSDNLNPDKNKASHFGQHLKPEHMKDGNQGGKGYGSASPGRKASESHGRKNMGSAGARETGKKENRSDSGNQAFGRKSAKK